MFCCDWCGLVFRCYIMILCIFVPQKVYEIKGKCIFCIWTSDECLAYNRKETSSRRRHIKESEIHLFLILYQKYHCKPIIICDDFISIFTLDVARTNTFSRLLLYRLGPISQMGYNSPNGI